MTQARDLGDAANKANFLDNVSSDIQTQVTANILPAGLILPFGNTTAPTGFLECRGQLLNRTHYARLFAAIGTVWNTGGEYNTEFRLPDLRGAFLRGTGSHGTSNMANGNDFAGPSVGSFENDQFQDFQVGGLGAGGATYYGKLAGSDNTRTAGVSTSGEDFPRYAGANSGNTNRLTALTDSTNGNPRKGDETRPFNAGILYCIKT